MALPPLPLLSPEAGVEAAGGGSRDSSHGGGPGPSSGGPEVDGADSRLSGCPTPITSPGRSSSPIYGSEMSAEEDDPPRPERKRRRGLSDNISLGPPTEDGAGSAVLVALSERSKTEDRDRLEVEASQILINKYKRTGNDLLLKHLLNEQKMEKRDAEHAQTPIGVMLAAKAKNDFAAAEERRKENAEIARRHARELEDRKVEAARLQLEAERARLQTLRWKIIERRDLQSRREAEERSKVTARWLQVEFPTQLARRCIDWHQGQRRRRREE